MLHLQNCQIQFEKILQKLHTYFKVQKWQLSNISNVKLSEIIEFFLFFKMSIIYLKQLFHF